MRPVRAYLAWFGRLETDRTRDTEHPTLQPQESTIYLPEVDATQQPHLSGGGDCVANYRTAGPISPAYSWAIGRCQGRFEI